MKNFTFNFVILLIVILSGALGYWAVTDLDYRKAIIVNENTETVALVPQNESPDLSNEVDLSEQVVETNDPVPTPPPSQPSEYADLFTGFDDLISNNIIMKQGSRGSRVGVVQKFLNIYFETNNAVDNDYGPGTKQRVINYQKAQGLTADGETGPTTYRSMVSWLENN